MSSVNSSVLFCGCRAILSVGIEETGVIVSRNNVLKHEHKL